MGQYLTPADVGRRLGCTPAAVRAMERRGVLKAAARTERGGRLFREADVAALGRKRGRSSAGGRHA
jgi:DNA-binding transcriptional MerR regulator